MRIASFFSILFVFSCGLVCAQSNTNSPYSRFALGDLIHTTNINSTGMGGVGLSFTNQFSANILNPSLLSRNNNTTIFDAGGLVERKVLTNNQGQQRDFGGNLSYMAFVFPLSRRSGMSLGFLPISKINYRSFSIEKDPNSNSFTQYIYTGSGGVTQLYASVGYRVWRGLSLGAQAAYNFGLIKRQAESLVDEPGSLYTIERLRRYNFGDVSMKMGLSYRQKLKESLYANIGAVHSLESNLNASYLYALQRNSIVNGLTLVSDTITNAGDLSFTLPSSNSIGISIEKTLHYAIAIDFKTQDWSNFKGFDNQDTLTSSYEWRVGGEWTPNFNATTGYFRRANYRLGFAQRFLPITVRGTQIQENSISFGISLPAIKPTDLYHSFSRVNLAFVLGQRGTLDNELIRERFWRIHLGLNINQLWFLRRKYD
ncbi:MAG: hypothetical protein EAZ57_03545 [Cytophagales bacterium]|nr:MAG: hypothetical protein EAZ67_04010 [Cytophagales bacterium]TAF61537.1 MAG: hypothetical protein EAZ57_03545 [Cytophagales bacterium]